jgi:hypothetical protein
LKAVAKQLHEDEAWTNADGTPTTQFAEAILELIRESDEMSTNKQLALIRPDGTSATAIYTSPTSKQGGKGTVITQFSAADPTNTDTFDVHIGTSATASNKIVSAEVALKEGETPPAILNAMINPGESLYVKVTTADRIVFSVAGIEKR